MGHRSVARRDWKHPASVYRKYACKHAAQGAVFLSAMTFGLCAIGLGILVLIVGEVVLLMMMPRLSSFRRDVDKELDEEARTVATAARESIIVRMSDVHRRELEYLERLIDQVQQRLSRGTRDELPVDGWLGCSRLIATYARFAIAHKASAECFAPVSRVELAAHADQLEVAAQDRDGAAKVWIRRRLVIARERLAAWDRASSDREVMAHGMATIGELVRFLHEQSATSSADPMRTELEELLDRWQDDVGTLRELVALGDKCEPIDAQVFALAQAQATQSPRP